MENKINSYVVSFNDKQGLFDEYKTIQGKTAKEALKKAFNKDYKRLTGDAGRYANIILIKGYFENNTIHYVGKYQQLCYGEIN